MATLEGAGCWARATAPILSTAPAPLCQLSTENTEKEEEKKRRKEVFDADAQSTRKFSN